VLFQLAGDVVLETESAVALLAGYPPETLDAYDAGPSSGLDCVGPAEIGLDGAAYAQGERCRRQLPHADRLYWAAIRADLVRPSNALALANLREALVLSAESHKQRLARVSDVRLIDMIVWRIRVGGGLSVP
jgi:hypothetical protein